MHYFFVHLHKACTFQRGDPNNVVRICFPLTLSLNSGVIHGSADERMFLSVTL